MTLKQRMQEIIDEAEHVKHTDKRIWIVLCVLLIVAVLISYVVQGSR